MKVAVIGGTLTVFNLLSLLDVEKIKVTALILQPPDAHEDPEPFNKTVKLAETLKISILIAKKFDQKAADFLVTNNIDIACLINCRFLIPNSFIDVLPYGFLVTHGSVLPEYRGFAPLNWALLNGSTYVGITLFKAVSEVDAGPILETINFPISNTATAKDIFNLFSEQQPLMFLRGLQKVKNDPSFLRRLSNQDNKNASYCCRRMPNDSEINWNLNSEQVYRLIRSSQYPYPLAFTFIDGKTIKIIDAEIEINRKKFVGIVPGRVVDLSKEDGWVDVLCGDGVIRLKKVLFEGHEMSPANIIKSLKITLGLNYTQEIQYLKSEIANLKKMLTEKHKPESGSIL